MQHVTVQDVEVPAVGLGTWQMTGEECRNAVMTSLERGYRHIDTAQMYGNEDIVGDAIAAADVERAEVFLTTKINRGNMRQEAVLESFAESRAQLGTDYVDLLLIHTPSQSVPIEETISAMNQLQDEGTVRYIGVSNFSVQQTKEAVETSSTPILTNQVKYHPFYGQPDLVEYCIENDVLLTAYSPLAQGDVVSDDTLTAIGEQYGKTAAQVALRWLIQQPNVVPIPKTVSQDHLTENIAVFDFALTDEEMQQVFELQGGLLNRIRDKIGL